MARRRKPGWIIDNARFDDLVTRAGKSRAKISEAAGIEDSKVGARLWRGTAFDEREVDKLAVVLGCAPSAFATPSTGLEASGAKSPAQPAATNAELEVFKSDDMRRKYATFDQSSFVLVFSLDGFLEAENLAFRDTVFAAVRRGLEIFYLFPDSEVAAKSRAQFEAIAKLAQKENLRVHGHLVDAGNTYVATRAARFVLLGTKAADGTRLVEEILLYIHSKQDYWIRLDLIEHQDFVAELQAAIDPIPYMPIPIWKERWHLPPFVQERYQTSFTRDSETYSRIRRIVRTGESAERIATRALRHFTETRFDRENDVINWLDIGCEDGENTSIIYEYLRTHHYRVALTAIDTSLQPEESPILRYCTFLHGKKWTFEHFAHELPRSQKFDLITSLHSWYVIDPIYLVEAYRRLSVRGALIVTMGPYGSSGEHRGNFINMVTGAIDELVAQEARLKPQDDLYQMKVVRSDPYRNYAEDIIEAFRQFFGERDRDFFVDVDDRRVPAADVMDGVSLNDVGRDIGRFFTHGLSSRGGEAILLETIGGLLRGLRDADDMLPAAEVDITVDRQSINRSQGRKLRLVAREPEV